MKRPLSLATCLMEVAHARHDNAIATAPTARTKMLHGSTTRGRQPIHGLKGDTPVAHTASTKPIRPCITPATFHPCHPRQRMHPWTASEDDIRRVMLSPTHTFKSGQDTKRAESDNEATKRPKDL